MNKTINFYKIIIKLFYFIFLGYIKIFFDPIDIYDKNNYYNEDFLFVGKVFFESDKIDNNFIIESKFEIYNSKSFIKNNASLYLILGYTQ